MKRNARRILTLILAMAMALGMLAGCGGDDSSTPSNGNDAQGGTTAPSTPAAPDSGSSGGGDYSGVVITYGMTTAWDTVNPYGSSSGSLYQNVTVDTLYDRLAFIEEAGTGVSPRGAKSWESADGGLSILFHLDENAKWHDGEPVTAADWVWTAQLITNPAFPFGLRSEFNTWAGTGDDGAETGEKSVGLEAVDEYTLKMTLKSAMPAEDWLILHNKYFYVLPQHLLGDIPVEDLMAADFWKNPVGSGPCTFISEISGSELQLGAFADYHMGAPKFGKLVIKVIANTNTVTSVAAGEMDAFFGSPTVDDALAAESLSGVDVTKSSAPTGLVSLIINNQNVSDKRIRQAIAFAVDKELLIEQSLQGMGVASSTCIIPGSEYDAGIQWQRDVDKDKELLAEAGWDPNATLTMAIGSSRESMAAVIQQNLAEAGIKVDIQTVEVATMFSGLQDGTYDLGISGSTAMGYPLWMSGYYDYRNATYCQISDHAYADLQEAIAAEMDEAKRKDLVKEYQELLWDQMPLVPVYHGYSFSVKASRLQGYNGFESAQNNQRVWEWSVTQ